MHDSNYSCEQFEVEIDSDFTDPPNVTASSSISGPATVGEDRVVLSCDVEANPEANIIWRKVGSLKIVGDTDHLVLDPVTVEDGGNYTCRASNELGHHTSNLVEVNTYCESKY